MGQIEANQVLFVITEVKIHPVYLIAIVADGMVLFWYTSAEAVRGLVRS